MKSILVRRRPSVRVSIIWALMHRFRSNFGSCFSGPYTRIFFFFFKLLEQRNEFFLRIFFISLTTWEPNFKTLLLQITAESFQTFLNFFPNGPHKTALGIFEILKIKIWMNLFRFPYHGTLREPTFQNASPPTNRSRKFSNFPEFSFQWSSQNYVWDF